VLINQGQRRSSNLGFRTLHAEQQRNTFMIYIGGILAIRYIGNIVILADIYQCANEDFSIVLVVLEDL